MANAFTLPNGKTQFFDANGKPLAGGKVYHYVPATTVPKDTYQDVAGATPNTNPVVLDAAGEAVIFGVGAYRQILNDALGNLLWDQVTQAVSPATLGAVNIAGDSMTGTLVVPSLSDTGQQLVTTTPTGDPITTLTSLNVSGTTVSTTTREFLGAFSLTANKRNGAAGSVTPSVALYSGVNGVVGTSDIWAIRNVAVRAVGSGTYNMFGSEIDINNNNADYGNGAGAAGLAAPVTYGIAITGAGSFKNTAAMLISGPGTAIWNRGVCVTQNSVAQAAFQDLGNSTTSYDLQGTHTNGIDTLSATISAHAIRVADSHIIGVSVSSVNRAMLQHTGTNLYIGDATDGNVVSRANFIPNSDNLYQVGGNINRWTSLWAVNGTIQTSDPSLKKSITPLSSLKADVIQKLVASINPISFQWIDGGKVPSVDEAPGLVQATEDVIVSDLRVEIVNGAPVRKEHARTETRPVVDMTPVVEKNGDTVMIESHDGTKHPLLHPVPRMVQGIVKTQTYKSVPGKRVHWGWDASEVKAAFDGVGLDFGGYVKDENGGQHLRPDQLIPVLWQAVKNLTARIETLEKGPSK